MELRINRVRIKRSRPVETFSKFLKPDIFIFNGVLALLFLLTMALLPVSIALTARIFLSFNKNLSVLFY